MIFVARESFAPTLFCLAIMARSWLAVVGVHWTVVGMAFLLGRNPDENLMITLIFFVAVTAMVFGIATYTRRKVPGVEERMAAGPKLIVSLRSLVVIVGCVSNVGGLLLFVEGYRHAGWWAMGMGTAMVAVEVSAAVHAATDSA